MESSAASAPGKLILFGEHAVVYGKQAVATCLSDLRVMVTATPRDDDDVFEVIIPDIAASKDDPTVTFSKSWPVAELAASLGPLFPGTGPSVAPVPGADVTAALEKLVDGCTPLNAKAIAPTLYLAVGIMGTDLGVCKPVTATRVEADGSGADVAPTLPAATGCKGVTVRISLPTLPVAAGLGSSAAFSVATSAALLDLHSRLYGGCAAGLTDPDRTTVMFGSDDHQFRGGRFPLQATLSNINDWAFAAETLFHGRPSGLDNTVSCYGGALAYVSHPKSIEHLQGMPPLRLLVTNTKVPKDTKALVAGVRVLYDKMPAVLGPVLAAIEAVSQTFVDTVKSGPPPGETVETRVASLVSINQSLLEALGVGHPALTALCAASRRLSMSSKLTGAGGGGCGFTLIHGAAGDELESQVSKLKSDLATLGYECFETTAGGPGVLLHTSASVGTSVGAGARAGAGAGAGAKPSS